MSFDIAIMTTYLKIAILISLLLLQVPTEPYHAPAMPITDLSTVQQALSVCGEDSLSPDVISTALAEY
jgi:hypothetical protein